MAVCFIMPRVSGSTRGVGGGEQERAGWLRIRSGSGRNSLRGLRGCAHVSILGQADTGWREGIDRGGVRSGPPDSSIERLPDEQADALLLFATVCLIRCAILLWRGPESRDTGEVGSTPPCIVAESAIVPANVAFDADAERIEEQTHGRNRKVLMDGVEKRETSPWEMHLILNKVGDERRSALGEPWVPADYRLSPSAIAAAGTLERPGSPPIPLRGAMRLGNECEWGQPDGVPSHVAEHTKQKGCTG